MFEAHGCTCQNPFPYTPPAASIWRATAGVQTRLSAARIVLRACPMPIRWVRALATPTNSCRIRIRPIRHPCFGSFPSCRGAGTSWWRCGRQRGSGPMWCKPQRAKPRVVIVAMLTTQPFQRQPLPLISHLARPLRTWLESTPEPHFPRVITPARNLAEISQLRRISR